MKTLLFVLAMAAMAAFAYAELNPTGGPTPMTATQVLNSTPTYVGQSVLCTNCTSANGSLGVMCHSTETVTARNGYIITGSSLPAVTACQ